MPIAFSDDRPPIPPAELIYRVVPPFGSDSVEENRAAFDRAARGTVRDFEAGLTVVRRELTEFERVLDFGCGPGRVLRHLGPVADKLDLHGVDIDPDLVAWCQANIPYATCVVGPHEPPLPYEDGAFDLVFNHSVFTHIDEHRQNLWLAEIHRILRPGGVALLTVHSARQFNQALKDIGGGGEDIEGYRRELEEHGLLFIADDHYIGSTHPSWYHTTFHAPWYVFEHWSRWFRVAGYLQEGSHSQDMVVLERQPDNAPANPAIGHRSAPAAAVPAAEAAPSVAVPARSASPNSSSLPASQSLDRARASIASAPTAPTLPGRVKGRVLRSELGRQQRVQTDLLDAVGNTQASLDELRAEVQEMRAEIQSRARTLLMFQQSLYDQNERARIAERDLRDALGLSHED